MKITEGARSIRATVVKAFSLSSSLFVSLSLSLTHSPPGISVGSGRCQFRSALSESRSIGSWAVWIRSRERNKPRPDSAKTGLLPAATVKKRESGRKDRLYARLKHEEDASREYYALRVPGNKSKMNAWCAVTKSGGGGKNSIPVPYQPLQVVNYGEDSFPSLFFPLFYSSFWFEECTVSWKSG